MDFTALSLQPNAYGSLNDGMTETPGKRIVIASFGSLGDLHPFLALAQELRSRGHHPVIATAPFYSERIQALGFEFEPLGPPVSPQDPQLIHRLMRTVRGPEYLFRKMFLPHVPEMYAELERICSGADLLIAGEMVLPAPILAEKTGIPFVSVLLSPISFLSPYDPSVLPALPFLTLTHGWPLVFQKALVKMPALAFRRWSTPLRNFRKSLGLPDDPEALRTGKLKANLVLAMFSPQFAKPQPDWPAHTVQTGFAHYEQESQPEHDGVQERIDDFLNAGTPPIVFTLGSAAVHAPGDFFWMSARAAHRLKMRAILVGDPRGLSSPNILTVPYADYSKLFPRAAIIVHQGGIGTTAEALRSGRPQVVVPFNFDQPDNAARVVRLGVGLKHDRRMWKDRQAHYSLIRLIRDNSFAERAAQIGELIRKEDGTTTAVNAVEHLLAAR
ncbi:glycosyltransferase [Terriglobus roseus]|uniref:UDP:flavonoid glycosyltransferase YjiC, YdhE family n=1 Tax=Terriglobus roseus TaxID=392734 RepID=A0A1G7M7X9_9BACT|nr:glycosyltransferase [Terriglobus roseus]SDF57785.1 UDP:flavonoid glycosyltransferase YjiC, YdhE family [Terriglobus roseus]